MAYEKRAAAFAEWDDSRFPNQFATGAGIFDYPGAEDVLREAFNAGWAARKKAEYEAMFNLDRDS